ncbi:uncharacterized protein Z519_10814 [Cladophialophora bantiana CBS 173.52]|uniref:Uncharacterized protein n=1 Tax=Cladophialophora bantiana (strain ATCC 10958 / CBS 173.52 / CDC B-1940 / NIH 8579) TaxID=1442370 RepID=A0A0D2FQ95_CLAB1|nr:uncharacterized protein Z519_10814 [Cladophialophora bantiana CBS 173.52]KIW88767.1 hypothetical protein Z519_10814 [Cladophialophora bantiana CBS 173.52]
MAVIPTKALRPRGDSSGRTFSIIFAVVAFLVVFGCVIWGIILPKYRKRRDTHPLGARYMVTPSYPPFSPPPRFPSHPALLHNFRKQPQTPVQHYDPRTESPFPNSPAPNSPAQLNAIYRPPQVGSSNAVGLSYGPFNPPQCWLSTRLQPQHMPQGNLQRARKVAGTDPRNFTTFKGKHDYILPVPEPVVLKPRPAGRPPPLTRQLERFPIPLSSGRNGGLVHPTKLFQELEQRGSKSTADTFGTPCPTTHNTTHLTDTQMLVMKPPAECKTPPGRPQRELLKVVECKTHNSPQPRRLPVTRILPINRDEAGTPKTKTEKQERLERMGTLTRPKTPVAEIRDWFDRAANTASKEKVSSKPYTPSTNPFTTPGATSTPPTSPIKSAKKSRSLVTPSRPQSAAPCINVPSHAHRRTPSSAILPSPEKLNALRIARPSKRVCQAAKGSPAKIFKQRSISRRAKLVSWSQLRPCKRISRRYSSSSLSTIFKPILTTRSKHSRCTSSIYSRDMRGLSPTGGLSRQGGDAESNDRVELPSGKGADLTRNPSTSVEHVKSKIDNWDLHTGHLDASIMPRCAIKRSNSDSGLRRSTLRNCEDRPASGQEAGKLSLQGPGKSIPLIQIGRPSDDVFGIEADGFQPHEASKLMKRIGNFETAPLILGGLGRGTAPGGGDWI